MTTPRPRLSAILTPFLLSVPLAAQGTPSTLEPGDLILSGTVEIDGEQIPDALVKVDLPSGELTLLTDAFATSSVELLAPFYLAVQDSRYVFGNRVHFSQGPEILRYDVQTGELKVFSDADLMQQPRGMAVEPCGDLLVLDELDSPFPPDNARALRLSGLAGVAELIAEDAFLSQPRDLWREPEGTYLVADAAQLGAIYRFDPSTGEQTLISDSEQGSLLSIASSIGVGLDGDVVVNGAGNLIRVDPKTGQQSTAFGGGTFQPTVRGIKRVPGYDLIVAAWNGLYEFDTLQNQMIEIIGPESSLVDVRAIAVVEGPPQGCECGSNTWSYGNGWPGTDGIPALEALSDPVAGGVFQLQVGNTTGKLAHGCLVAGPDVANLDLGIGGLLLVSEATAVKPFTVPAGLSTVEVPISPFSCGVRVALQWVLVDPGASHGLALSPGLEVLVGQP